MAEYKTEQKRLLLGFLKKNSDKAYTIEELIEKMSAEGGRLPGKSTVYRLMTHLVEEGTVKRFVRGNSRKFAYQIVIGEHCERHLHLKCICCGRLLHLDEDVSRGVLDQVFRTAGFSVSEQKTVLFGSCLECSK